MLDGAYTQGGLPSLLRVVQLILLLGIILLWHTGLVCYGVL